MSGPDFVRIKRKRDEPAPEALLVERAGKRQQQEDLHYVLQKDRRDEEEAQHDLLDAKTLSQRASAQAAQNQVGRSKQCRASGSGLDAPSTGVRERRIFHLKRPSTPEAGVKKRKAKEDGIATFVEKRAKRNAHELLSLAERGRSDSQTSVSSTENMKRPGKGAAVKTNGATANNTTLGTGGEAGRRNQGQSHVEAMANALHRFAVEEAAKETPPKPKVKSVPKLPSQHSRNLRRQRAISSATTLSEHMDVDEEADYVYDTYVLAPTDGIGAAQVGTEEARGNVGYLVITEEDQAAWETYIEDEPSDKDWNSDEDDENAEDWYGADYPDEELASDDEFNRNAYGYRAGSDGEEWDPDTGNWSDEEYERQTQPWRKKTPQQFAKYLDGALDAADEDEG